MSPDDNGDAETDRLVRERRERRARGEYVPNGSRKRGLVIKRANLREAEARGYDPTFWKRSLARGRRAVRRERLRPALRLPRRDRRPSGGRPAGRRTRSPSARAGPSGDDGPSSEGDGEPPPPVLFLVDENYGRVSRGLARFLREVA